MVATRLFIELLLCDYISTNYDTGHDNITGNFANSDVDFVAVKVVLDEVCRALGCRPS